MEKHSKTKEMGLKRNYVLVFNGHINEYKYFNRLDLCQKTGIKSRPNILIIGTLLLTF